MTILLIALGGGAGAVLRYLIDHAIKTRLTSTFPWGTLLANTVGCGLLGLLSGWALTGSQPDSLRALLAIGFCGALTTFSTFSYETILLMTARTWSRALANVALTLIAGFFAAIGGLSLAALLW